MSATFIRAQRAYRKLPRRYEALEMQPTAMALWWRTALEKDETGLQCIRLVDDIEERHQPLRW